MRVASAGGTAPTIGKENVSVSLSPNRGGKISSIAVIGIGETIVEDRDGRGMGTSGIPSIELGNENGGVWNEGVCDGGPTVRGGNGDSDVSFESGPNFILGRANTLVNWNVASPDCRTADESPDKHLQISHNVTLPIANDGAVRFEKYFSMRIRLKKLTPSAANTGYSFPFTRKAIFITRLAKRCLSSEIPRGVGMWLFTARDSGLVFVGNV